ncbi:hypothetical protein OQI89_10995 [Lentilactobacillus diolivorans]|uniref:hypothetical protein n=1 Tax=Lentilactobacillus diolivorans TaxID=179838 RepID=UPI00246928B6|nr:hypothetical protein [Lentilactobacillus diolivorans]MDH5106379.1 hypothetical protein [Lentilactobacillus diolivorans]
MKAFLQITDCLMQFFMIGIWFVDWMLIRYQGRKSSPVAALLQRNASGLRIALKGKCNVPRQYHKDIDRLSRKIDRWYWLSHKKLTLVVVLSVQEWLIFTAKQGWGLVAVELSMLTACMLILIADYKANSARLDLENMLSPYQDRLWFEYSLRKE